ncbi:hypothetical protein ACIRU3_27545 [Streptomyces sp. NPDC101151]|uniref:hypothetical protein n=1 Tax=Streptomyces sp. NPDC101151 TaxID=3366115 RepID=UPI0037F9BE13
MCLGHFIDRIAFDAFAMDDSPEITLREGPHKPDVLISPADVHYVSVATGADDRPIGNER